MATHRKQQNKPTKGDITQHHVSALKNSSYSSNSQNNVTDGRTDGRTDRQQLHDAQPAKCRIFLACNGLLVSLFFDSGLRFAMRFVALVICHINAFEWNSELCAKINLNEWIFLIRTSFSSITILQGKGGSCRRSSSCRGRRGSKERLT